MERFDFLKTDYEDIYKLCSEAEINHNMNKARQVIEILVRKFGATKRHLFERIGELSDRNIIPQNVVDAFHQVRIVGNKDSHGNELTEAEINNGLNQLFEIVVWLAVGHDKKIYRATDFNTEDLPIVEKYLDDDVKSKRDKLKKIGLFINSLDISQDTLNFDNDIVDELAQDVFETKEEYVKRINNLPLKHIGYAILDSRAHDKYTGLTFAMFHIENNDKIIFSDIAAFTADMKDSSADFIDGKIVVGLKVFNGKIYCDYERIYLQSQSGDKIKLTAICWKRYEYEHKSDFLRRMEKLPVLPLGIGKPVRKEYNLSTQLLPFKVALYKYVQTIFNFNEVFAKIDRETAKKFCSYNEPFTLYSKVNAHSEIKILRHSLYEKDIKAVLEVDKLKKKSGKSKKKSAEIQDIIFKSSDKIKQNPSEIRRKAKEGDIFALHTLGNMYRKGDGVKQNGKTAIKYLKDVIKMSAKSDVDIEAVKRVVYNEIGDIYLCGDGIEKNGASAARYFKKAAALSNINAMFKLAEMFLNGNEISQDSIQAVKYYKKIIKLSSDVDTQIEVMKEIAEIYKNGQGIEKDEVKSQKWYKKIENANKKLMKAD